MAKKRFQCWLSESALAELERRAGAKDKRQAYLETLLTVRPLFGPGPIEDKIKLIDKPHPLVTTVIADGVERARKALEARFCEHGAAPGLCKVAKCRKT
jgi:hypothetical protein